MGLDENLGQWITTYRGDHLFESFFHEHDDADRYTSISASIASFEAALANPTLEFRIGRLHFIGAIVPKSFMKAGSASVQRAPPWKGSLEVKVSRIGFFALVLASAAATAFAGCGDDQGSGTSSASSSASGSASGSSSSSSGGEGGSGGGGADLDMTEADFGCILKWDKVRLFRITNLLGNVDGALAAANAPGTMDYPVGTVIQLIPNEAMVKRKKGFAAASNDWEFFFLDTSATGTKIIKRGVTDVVNQFNGNCLNCHAKAMKEFDFVCEKTHGCDPLPIGDDVILSTQNGDPRCMP